MGLLAELTHRCPLRCPYCSNPLELARAAAELDTGTWQRIFGQAAELGILQIHLSGGEPTARRDLEGLIRHASGLGLYTNLITSAVLLDARRLEALAEAGLDHVQISIQDSEPASADRIAGYAGHERKLAAGRAVRKAGLALTINAVVHRQNLDRLDRMIALAEELGAHRMEVAHVQYYGWALRNRAALIPSGAQLEAANAAVAAARARLGGRMVIDYVVPDYYAERPKACMAGWGRRFMTVAPDGTVLPCHAAKTIPGLSFDSVRDRSLAEIWSSSPAFHAFRGTEWMPDPCRSCERKEVDWGGCRCQAMALTGDPAATDPACGRSEHHRGLRALARREASAPAPDFVYRGFDPSIAVRR